MSEAVSGSADEHGKEWNSVVLDYISNNKVILFSETTNELCDSIKQLFQSKGINEYCSIEVNEIENGD